MTRRKVNARQREVLDWIVAGCPPTDWPDTTYKSTAIALQGRRLVTVSKRRGVWRAEPTAAGLFYASHGTYPDGHWPKASAERANPAPSPSASSSPNPPDRRAATGVAKSRKTPRVASPSGRAAAARLLADLEAAGGAIDITIEERQHYLKVARTLRATKGLLPNGKTVVLVSQRYKWKVVLQDVPPPREPLTPIVVSSRLSSRPHPVVGALRQEGLKHLSKDLRPRVLRCADALAREAERRGYKATSTERGLKIEIRGLGNIVEFKEPQSRSEHAPTEQDIANAKRWSYRSYPAYDYAPSGRLRITAVNSSITDPPPRADGQVGRLVEDRLAEVLERIERNVEGHEQRERQREQEAAERRRLWDQVHADALVEYGEHYRGQVLLDRAARYAETLSLDNYLAALDRHIAAMDDPVQRAAAEEWRVWAGNFRARRDPFAKPPQMPTVPEPSRDDLAPFMRGLSVWGPN